MKRHLLIGAGFSHNWGGWLATEAFEFLLGDPAVMANDELRAALWRSQSRVGFELALDELERSPDSGLRRHAAQLRAALRRMFETMNAAFSATGLEFKEPVFSDDRPVANFLLRFDAIFSLNQDLLLERWYRGSKDGLVDRTNLDTERDWQFPGMKLLLEQDGSPVYPSALGAWAPSGDYSTKEAQQPIFKLHGSSNWRTAEKSEIMILGGGKRQAIERHPILKWYSQIFAESLDEYDTRLMIIGYGFRDDHINDTLTHAMDRGLKVFVIDPLGADAVCGANPLPRDAIGYKPIAIEESMKRACIGASRRPLSSTFSSDHVERQKIERFFVN
jgi:hypothetical protein